MIINIKKNDESSLLIKTDPAIEKMISDHFSFDVEGASFSNSFKSGFWDGKVRLLNGRSKKLPIGHYHELKDWAKKNNFEIKEHIHQKYGPIYEETGVNLSFIKDYILTNEKGETLKPYDEQLNFIRIALSKKHALLLSSTSSGKSLNIYIMARRFIETTDKDVLIIVPTIGLVTQLYKNFQEYSAKDPSFDTEKIVYKLHGGIDPTVEKRITISTWHSIYENDQKYFDRFGMAIADEAHNHKAKRISQILTRCTEASYRIGATGSLDGTKTSELQLNGLFGPTYRVVSNKSMIEKGQATPLDIKTILLNYPVEDARKSCALTYQKEIKFLTSHDRRNRFISRFSTKLKGNTLVLFKEIAHGEELYKRIKEISPEGKKIFLIHGGVDPERREEIREEVEQCEGAVIVASYGTTSTGINIKKLHNIVFARPIKSQITVLQSIGRVLRLSKDGIDATLYDIVDNLSHNGKENHTLNHGRQRISIYEREGFSYTLHTVKIEPPTPKMGSLFDIIGEVK